MSGEIRLEPPLVLNFSESERKFNNLGELQEFVELERDAWLWLEKANQQDKVFKKFWGFLSSYLEEVSQLIGEYRQDPSNQRYIKKKLIDLQNKTYSVVNQGFILSASTEAQFIFKTKDLRGGGIAAYSLAFLKNIKADFNTALAIEGAYWAMQYRQGSTETVEAHQKALELMKHSWVVKFDKKHKEFQEKLADLERTYKENLALQSSFKYWDKKRVHHQSVMWKMAVATAFFAVAVTAIFALVAYFLFEATTLSEVQLWKLGIMLAISSFGVWLIRLLSKIFISNLHLRTDADERVTMIKTYLALLLEGKGPKDDGRQLILQTLFRPSSTGFIKEDGPTGPYEAILNIRRND